MLQQLQLFEDSKELPCWIIYAWDWQPMAVGQI